MNEKRERADLIVMISVLVVVITTGVGVTLLIVNFNNQNIASWIYHFKAGIVVIMAICIGIVGREFYKCLEREKLNNHYGKENNSVEA